MLYIYIYIVFPLFVVDRNDSHLNFIVHLHHITILDGPNMTKYLKL